MGFSVFFPSDIAVSLSKVNKTIAHLSVCVCARTRTVHAPARCVHLFKLAQWATPMRHKSHERLSLAKSCSLKGNFDVCNWRRAYLKEGPTGV